MPSGCPNRPDSHLFTESLSGESAAGTADDPRTHASQAIEVLDYAQTKTLVVAAVGEPGVI